MLHSAVGAGLMRRKRWRCVVQGGGGALGPADDPEGWARMPQVLLPGDAHRDLARVRLQHLGAAAGEDVVSLAGVGLELERLFCCKLFPVVRVAPGPKQCLSFSLAFLYLHLHWIWTALDWPGLSGAGRSGLTDGQGGDTLTAFEVGFTSAFFAFAVFGL